MTTSLEGIDIVQVHRVPTREFTEERITGLLLPETKFTSGSVGFVPPQGAQTPHYQNRPEKGDEIIFVYAGKFRVVSGDWCSDVFDTAESGPVYLLVKSGTPASLKNTGDDIVRFFSVFSPPFQIGETQFVN